MLTVYLAIVFLLGGSSRADTLSLVVLRPLSVLACGVALASIQAKHLRDNKFIFAFAAALFLLTGFHLIPLPPSVWESLPGRDLIVEIDRLADLGEVWRPISMAPLATRNALYSLFTPLAVLLLCVQLPQEERFALLRILILIGLTSGLLGVLQIIGSANGPLYFYRVTNFGWAIGFLANRNHQALLLACLIPMLAVYATSPSRSVERRRVRTAAGVLACIVIIFLLLLTGSRSGLLWALIGILSSVFLYENKGSRNSKANRLGRMRLLLMVAGALVAIAGVALFLGRAAAVDRFSTLDTSEDLRFYVWGPIIEMGNKYFPVGSGMGSFVEAYKVDEPSSYLATTYLNHAHNDWLELYMTGGALSLVLMSVAVLAWLRCSVVCWYGKASDSRGLLYGKLGSILLFMVGLASIFDYPLRVPSLACSAVIFSIWLSDGLRWRRSAERISSGKNNDLQLAQAASG